MDSMQFKAKHCTTHHESCACREYKFRKMERALDEIKILVLGRIDADSDLFDHIVSLCKEAVSND